MKKIKTKFYTFSQNNSGGSFVNDPKNGIGQYVVIEAKNAESANSIAQQIGIYFNGCDDGTDCQCCGDRWYSVDESDGSQTPSLYGKPIEETEESMFRTKSFVHYLNGSIKEVLLKKKIQ